MTTVQPEVPADWFFVMTYQASLPGGGYAVETTDGIIPLGASSTRHGAFAKIMASCREHARVPAGAPFSILFFYLEPDLPGAPAQAPGVAP